MKQTVSYVDVRAFPEGERPAGVFPLRRHDKWLVMHHAPDADPPYKWMPCSDGDAVRVPLLALCTFNHDPSDAIAKAFEVGLDCGSLLPDGIDLAERKLFFGGPVEALHDHVEIDGVIYDCMRFWLGVAVNMK